MEYRTGNRKDSNLIVHHVCIGRFTNLRLEIFHKYSHKVKFLDTHTKKNIMLLLRKVITQFIFFLLSNGYFKERIFCYDNYKMYAFLKLINFVMKIRMSFLLKNIIKLVEEATLYN